MWLLRSWRPRRRWNRPWLSGVWFLPLCGPLWTVCLRFRRSRRIGRWRCAWVRRTRVATIAEFGRAWRCRHVRASVVYRSEQCAVRGRRLHVPILLSRHGYVALLLRSDFSGSWPRHCAAVAAIEADVRVRGVLVDDRCVVHVVDYGRIHIGDRAVIKIFAAPPVASKEPPAGITEAIINPAVETNGRSPVSRVPNVEAIVEPPVSGCPKKSYFRWENPRSWNPEVSVIAVRPIAGLPDVAGARTDRLHVHRQNRRRHAHRYNDAHISACLCLDWWRSKQKGTSQDQRTKQTGDTHKTHLSGVGWAFCISLARAVACGTRLLIRRL